MVLTGVDVTPKAIIILPLILELFVFSIALAFFLSALYVKFRDVSYIWEVILQAAFYATPIIYPLSLIPHRAAALILLTPMAQIIQDARQVLVTPTSQTIYNVYKGNAWVWAIPLGVTLIITVLASSYFKSRSKNFAEEI